MTSFGALSSFSAHAQSTQSTNNNIFDKAISNVKSSSTTTSTNTAGSYLASSTSADATGSDYSYKQEVMSGLGIGTGLDVSV